MSDSLLCRLSSDLAARGVPAYLVGGCVRDMLLARRTNDWDIALHGDPFVLAPCLARSLGGTFVPLDLVNSLARVVLPGGQHVDLARVRGGHILADLGQRDFTINAMALDLTPYACGVAAPTRHEVMATADQPRGLPPPLLGLIDPYGGWQDLQSGIIRVVGDQAFRDDPLRLLRAVRFRAELGFSIAADTEALIRHEAHLVAAPAAERVRDELARIVAVTGAADHLRLMDSLGLLLPLLPELSALKGVSQPPEHYWDVYEHSLQTVAELEWVVEHLVNCPNVCGLGSPGREPDGGNLRSLVSSHLSEGMAGGRSCLVSLKLAALLHDIAKPACRTVEPGGRIRFIGHQERGAIQAAAVLQRLRLSVREVQAAATIIRNHMRPAQLAEGELTRRAIYRYFRDTGQQGVSALLLSLADHRASRGPHLVPAEWERHVAFTLRMLQAFYQQHEQAVAPPSLLSGRDVMQVLGIPPGPLVGYVLGQVREAQAGGEVGSREEALALASKIGQAADSGAAHEMPGWPVAGRQGRPSPSAGLPGR